MTPVAQHAVALARAGYWQLLDAMELAERAATDGSLIGMLHAPGSEVLLGYADDDPDGLALDECDACDGTGESECHCCGHLGECLDCGGAGEVERVRLYGQSPAAVITWRNLSGEPCALDLRASALAGWLSADHARELVASYTRLVAALQA